MMPYYHMLGSAVQTKLFVFCTDRIFLIFLLHFPRIHILHVSFLFKFSPYVAVTCKGRLFLRHRVVKLFTQIQFVIEDQIFLLKP